MIWVDTWDWDPFVGGSMWIEDPHIMKWSFPSVLPETPSHNVYAGLIYTGCCRSSNKFLLIQGLKSIPTSWQTSVSKNSKRSSGEGSSCILTQGHLWSPSPLWRVMRTNGQYCSQPDWGSLFLCRIHCILLITGEVCPHCSSGFFQSRVFQALYIWLDLI